MAANTRSMVRIGLSALAQRAMHTQCELSIVPGATHLFEEPGALEEVSRLASNWFESCFVSAGPAAPGPAGRYSL